MKTDFEPEERAYLFQARCVLVLSRTRARLTENNLILATNFKAMNLFKMAFFFFANALCAFAETVRKPLSIASY